MKSDSYFTGNGAGWASHAREIPIHEAAKAACYAEGVVYRDMPTDGQWHRTDVADDPHGKGDASIKFFADGEGGMVCNWKGTGKPVFFWRRQEAELNPAEKEARRKRIEAEHQAAKQEQQRRWAEAATKARANWQSYRPAPSDLPQLAGKGILDAYGCKVTADSRLATPVYGPDDQIQSIQYRHADGKKINQPGGKMDDGFFWIGTPDKDRPIFVATSFTTAASIYQAMGEGHRVYFSYGDGNLEAVARMVQTKHSGRRIVLCGDDDIDKPGNPGRTKAEAASKALGLPVVFPEFGLDRPKGATDFNDLANSANSAEVARQLSAAFSRNSKTPPPFPVFSLEELNAAKSAPKCIVENYLYANLALVAAAGGTGKTTMMIYEAVHIALGRDLWGLKVWNPGKTLFITAEDERELFAARLKGIMDALGLSLYERNKVLSRIAVWDVSGELLRLAELDQAGNIRLTTLADDIVTAYKDDPPLMIVFDPCVSFGPGERAVNDGEQAIVTACRRIIRGLGCCVRIVHHTGKANARDGAIDQYAARGGTALPDGSRMVAILSSVNDGPKRATPDGWELAEGDSGFILARAKLSYAPPQPVLWIKRRGYAFEYFIETRQNKAQNIEANKQRTAENAERLLEFLAAELEAGRKHTKTELEQLAPKCTGMTRAEVREARNRLVVDDRLIDVELPQGERRRNRITYLAPNSAKPSGRVDQNQPQSDLPKPQLNSAAVNSAAYRRNGDGRVQTSAIPSPFSTSAAQSLAEFGRVGRVDELSTSLPSTLTPIIPPCVSG